jgi:integrase
MGKASPDDLVFPKCDFSPRSPNSLTKEWREAVARTPSIRAVTLHSLRHTHTSHLIAARLDVLAISRRLGHGSPTITLSIYGDLFSNADDRAASAIETAFIGSR